MEFSESTISQPSLSSFPQNPEEFDGDPRVSYSKIDQKFILEADDGQEYEFDDALKRWIPVVCPHPPTKEDFHAFTNTNTYLLEWAVSNCITGMIAVCTVGRCITGKAKRGICRQGCRRIGAGTATEQD